MAPRLHYEPRPPRQIGPTAREELDVLLQSLHDHGFLRMANDLVAANQGVGRILVNGLTAEGTTRALQNVAILAMALSRIDPGQFYRVVFALKDGLSAAAAPPPNDGGADAPGLSGAYRMLNDEDLWRALTPLIEGLKLFARGMERAPEKPVTQFYGKPTEA